MCSTGVCRFVVAARKLIRGTRTNPTSRKKSDQVPEWLQGQEPEERSKASRVRGVDAGKEMEVVSSFHQISPGVTGKDLCLESGIGAGGGVSGARGELGTSGRKGKGKVLKQDVVAKCLEAHRDGKPCAWWHQSTWSYVFSSSKQPGVGQGGALCQVLGWGESVWML